MVNNIFKKKNILEKNWKKKFGPELERQLLHHEITYIKSGNQLTVSPILRSTNVINLGSGYGFWSYDIYRENNLLNITNIDLIEFKIDDLENDYYENVKFKKINLKKNCLNIKYNSIDFIYQRDMISVYTRSEWRKIIKEIYNVLDNFGQVEFVEFDFIIKHEEEKNDCFNSTMVNEYLINIFEKSDYIFNLDELLEIIEIQFKQFDLKKFKLPLYEYNSFNRLCIKDLILSYAHIKDELEQIYSIKFEEYIEKLKKEWEDNKSYIELYIICCRK